MVIDNDPKKVAKEEDNVHPKETCQEKYDEAQRIEGKWFEETKQEIDIMHWCGTNSECKIWIKEEPLKHIEQCFKEGKLKM